jgi:hypothetical protein
MTENATGSTPSTPTEERTESQLISEAEAQDALDAILDDIGAGQALALREIDTVETATDLFEILGFEESYEITVELHNAELFYLVKTFDVLTQGEQPPEEFITRASTFIKLLDALPAAAAVGWMEAGYELDATGQEDVEETDTEDDDQGGENDE